jgi:hypothetical protein
MDIEPPPGTIAWYLQGKSFTTGLSGRFPGDRGDTSEYPGPPVVTADARAYGVGVCPMPFDVTMFEVDTCRKPVSVVRI